MSDDHNHPDFTSINAYVGGDQAGLGPLRATVSTIPWDQPATMIDLEGRVPVIATIRDCVTHFILFKPHARENARILLTVPIHRPSRKTRTWLLEPGEIAALAQRLADENEANG